MNPTHDAAYRRASEEDTMTDYSHLTGTELERGLISWDEDRVMLYAVGTGTGLDDPQRDLQFTTENTPGAPLQVLPTYLAQLNVSPGAAWVRLLGWGDDPWSVNAVHGQQAITLARPIPASGTVEITNTLDGVYDKGSGALVVMTNRLVLADTREFLGTSTLSVFVKGKGGFGGPRDVPGEGGPMPERDPDLVVSLPIGLNQSLIFRLLGDHNPHGTQLDRAIADGFERPIFFGLGSFGVAGRALLRGLCNDDVTRFGAIQGRFSQPAYPGDQFDVRIWRTEEGGQFQILAKDGRPGGERISFDRGLFRYSDAWLAEANRAGKSLAAAG